MISNDDVIRLAKWHENEAVRMVKHPDNLTDMCGLAEIHGETASALYMLLADRDAATMDADMQAREAGNMEFNARALMAERYRLRTLWRTAMTHPGVTVECAGDEAANSFNALAAAMEDDLMETGHE